MCWQDSCGYGPCSCSCHVADARRSTLSANNHPPIAPVVLIPDVDESVQVVVNVKESPVIELTLYAIRNNNGEWFRSKGRSGSVKTWNADIKNAKFYSNLSQARARVTYFANAFRVTPPEIVELRASVVNIINEANRLEAIKLKKQLEVETRKKADAVRELADAQRSLEEAQKKIDMLKNRDKDGT